MPTYHSLSNVMGGFKTSCESSMIVLGPLAQLVERCIRIAEARSSNLLRSTNKNPCLKNGGFCFTRNKTVGHKI